jgi:AcrR family transcriptional regulator
MTYTETVKSSFLKSELIPDDPRPLPPGLDLLWGRRSRGHRGPRPGLSVSAIVDAAIAIADAQGLAAVSMSRVAKELGFTPMSLYRHVASKEELLQLMWNASAQGAESLELSGEGWRERLRGWALIQWEMLGRHPWITQMPMAAPPMAPNSLTFVERGLQALDDTGLSDADKLRVIGVISTYTLSEARMANDARMADDARMANDTARALEPGGEGGDGMPVPSAPWSFEALLRELVDAETYPRLHRIAWSGEVGDAPSGFAEQDEFGFGLERILDGIEVLVARGGDS